MSQREAAKTVRPMRLRLMQLWHTYKPQRYRPVIASRVDHAQLLGDIAAALKQPVAEIGALWRDYQAMIADKAHIARLGQIGTTSSEEAFVLHCLLARFQPGNLIEIGTYEGGSTRRILDSIADLRLPTRVTTYDIVDMPRHFRPEEAALRLQDVTDVVEPAILDGYEPGIIYLDAHPWRLLHNVLRGVLKRQDWILVMHDCSPVLCNPRMSIPKHEPRLISMRTGHWERHALADVFGLADPLDAALDELETATHRLRIFGTQHGIALIMPKRLIADETSGPADREAHDVQ